MAHILIAYKQFPAPSVGHAGGESLFYLMEALHQRGHRLTLVARITNEERQHLPEVERICDRIVTVRHHRSRGGPRLVAILRSYLDLRRAIRETIQAVRPDFVHVETTQTAVIALGLPESPSSYRTQDVNWFLIDQRLRQGFGAQRLTGLRRWVAIVERALFRWLEPWVAGQYSLLLAISEGDRRLLARDRSRDSLLFVPLVPSFTGQETVAPAVDGDSNLLFVGAMSRDHNLAGVAWFLDGIWPDIAASVPDARFYIVGGHPPEALQRRADGKRVVVTGFVDDLATWYRAATVFVSPLLVAGGLLQKVMDAMAMGVPVVASSVCNHGVGAIPGEHLVTADEPEAFAAAVIELLGNPEARQRLGAAGRTFVREHYDLETAVDGWDAAIRRLVGER
ncbi:MAG: glycosyltransferase [Anaerolineae bacterium]|nr:glycosyltransferase [Anaerolineae bacterium]